MYLVLMTNDVCVSNFKRSFKFKMARINCNMADVVVSNFQKYLLNCASYRIFDPQAKTENYIS